MWTRTPTVSALGLALILAACSRGSDKAKPGTSGAAGDAGPATSDVRFAKSMVADPPAAPGAMAPNLAVVDGHPVAVWVEPGAKKTARRLRFARYAGGVWRDAVTILETEEMFANWADIPSVNGANGVLVAHWAKRSGPDTYAYDVALMRSSDGGKTWTSIGTAHRDGTKTEHGFVSMVPEGDGVRAFWLDGRNMKSGGHGHGHGGGAMTLRTSIIGKGAGITAQVDERVCDCCGTDTVQTPTGPLVVYRDRSATEVRDIFVVRKTPDGWTKPAAVHADGWVMKACPVNGPAAAARGQEVVVAWHTYAGGRPSVRVAFSADGGATFGEAIMADQPRGAVAPIGRVDVVMTGSGAAVVAWMATDRGEAHILARRVSRDGALHEPVVLSTTSAARSAGFPRMVRDADGLLVLWTATTRPTRVRGLRLPLKHLPTNARWRAPPPGAKGSAPLALGADMPAYTAVDLAGNSASLAALRGKPVLLNVWATWCEPCRREIPELRKLHAEHGASVHFVGVSIDSEHDAARVARYAKRARITYPVWLDHADRISGLFGVGMVPATFLFDAKGKLVWRHVGPVRADDRALSAKLPKL